MAPGTDTSAVGGFDAFRPANQASQFRRRHGFTDFSKRLFPNRAEDGKAISE